MSFQQLYYTSCEHGLTRYAGYQFNAVTDGTSGETMRIVESLTAYEPPRSHAYASDPADLERCPVNLCFSPGKTTVLANVRYVGQDSSRRFGNYFAHALATGDLDADDGDLLPIELWRADWWACQQAPDTSLPELDGPLLAGPMSRDLAASFLQAQPHRDKLPLLASAAGVAQGRQDRPVLVVADSADDVAMWFAAVSYLLPPRWVRRLSFSTYLSRPSRGSLHLLGTLAETGMDLGPDAAEKFYLFDFAGERFPADVPEHPLATLCAGLGLRDLPALWGWADSLADGRESTLGDWYPVVVAAAALGRVPLRHEDIQAAVDWLHARDTLEDGTRGAVARALHGQSALSLAQRRELREVSDRAGDASLWEQLHYEVLEPLLLERADGAAVAAALSPPAVRAVLARSAARVRDQLAARAEEQLRLTGDSADALDLLDWSGQAGLPITEDVLADVSSALIAPLAATDHDGHHLPGPQRDQAARVAGRWPQVRGGVVRYLESLAADRPSGVAAAMSGITGQLLTEQDIGPASPIRVPYLAARGLRARVPPAVILRGLAASGDIEEASDLLLGLLWPAGQWALADAADVLAGVDPRVLAGALGWFDALLARRPAPADRGAYAELCGQLVASSLARAPDVSQWPAIGAVAALHEACSAARRVADLEPVIRSVQDSASAPALVLTAEWVAPRLAAMPAVTPAELITALALLSPDAMRRYLRRTGEQFSSPTQASATHAAALWLIAPTEQGAALREQIESLLVYAARRWRPDQLARTATAVRKVNPASGEAFLQWSGTARHGRLFALARGLLAIGRLARATIPGHRRRAPADGTGSGR